MRADPGFWWLFETDDEDAPVCDTFDMACRADTPISARKGPQSERRTLSKREVLAC